MADDQDKKEPPLSHPKPAEQEIPLDTRLLSEAVIELNISRKNVGIYPPGHIQITKSIDRAYQMLQRMFEIRQEMTLGVAKDTLLVGQDYLDQKNPVYRDFALSLNQQGIAAVTFIKGLGREELVEFHRILTTKPEDVRASGGIEKVMVAGAMPHIRIQAIDYAGFHLTEEREIFRPSGRVAERSGSGVWQDFVSHLVTGGLSSPGEGVSLKDVSRIDPEDLARLLNERKIDSSAALQSYDHIISEHVRVMAEKKALTQEQSDTLSNLNSLIKDLRPELRKQFLSVAFRRVAPHAASPTAEDLLGGFPDNMVIDMLHQANAEGREISPTLTGLLQKLTQARESAPAGPCADRGEPPQGEAAQVISPEHMEKLFDREKYETYVSPDYDSMLKHLAADPGIVVEQFPVEEALQTLEDDYLDFQIGRALLAFMEEDMEEEDYREFSRKLAAVVPDLLKTGNFTLLLDIFETLRRHGREKPSEGLRAAAGESLHIFSDDGFITGAVSSFDRWAKTKGREGAGFLLAVGPASVPGLLDLFAVDETPGGRKILFDLLCNFGQPALNEAYKRLRDHRPHYVRNLLMLIRWAGNQTSAGHVKPLLQHPDLKVRMEALAALLRFKDASAIPLLREALASKNPDVSSQAVFFAGQYRVSAVLEDLAGMIKKVILFEADYTVNEEIIKALGEIGDARAVPELEKLARASLTLYPQSLARMKATLFESLGRYPRQSVAGLLKLGERSDDDRIKRACRKLMERK
jgi:hypothetical protein